MEQTLPQLRQNITFLSWQVIHLLLECICCKNYQFFHSSETSSFETTNNYWRGYFAEPFHLAVKNRLLNVSKRYFSFCSLPAHMKVICLPPAEGVPITGSKAQILTIVSPHNGPKYNSASVVLENIAIDCVKWSLYLSSSKDPNVGHKINCSEKKLFRGKTQHSKYPSFSVTACDCTVFCKAALIKPALLIRLVALKVGSDKRDGLGQCWL